MKSLGFPLLSSFFLVSFFAGVSLSLTGCDKVANTAKNIQSDWVGLDRRVEIYSCMNGQLLKVFEGDVRINEEDVLGTSLLIDGKKVNTNMCYIITEKGSKAQILPQ